MKNYCTILSKNPFGSITKSIITALLLLIIASCSSNDKKSDGYGSFEAEETLISSEVAGKIIHLQLNEGDLLKTGDIIAQIDTLQLMLRREQLLASISAIGSKTQNVDVQIDVLQKRMDNLLREKNRIERLLKDSAATQKQYDDITGELKVVERQIDATRSSMNTANEGLLSERKPLSVQIEQIDDQIAKCTIKSPYTATVLAKYAKENEICVPGKPLVKIADLSKLYLRVYVSGEQLNKVKIGGKADVIFDSGKDNIEHCEGTVTWVSSKAEFTPKIVQTRQERVNQVYAVKIEVANPDGKIKIGMPGEAIFK